MRLYWSILRRNGRGVLAVGVLVGIVAGIGLWSFAAARRTASAFTRYLEAAEVSDVSVDFFPAEEDGTFGLDDATSIIEQASMIDGVVADATYFAMESMVLAGVTPFDPSADPSSYPEFIGSLDGRFEVQDRIALSDGRLPSRSAEDEVLVSVLMANDRGLDVGDPLPIDIFDPETLYTADIGAPIGRIDGRIVGIGTFPEEVLADEYDRIARVLLSPAATQRWIEVTSYLWQGLRLDDPSAVPRVLEDYRKITGDGIIVISRVTSHQRESVQRSVRPIVVALTAFGIASMAAALAVGALAAIRLVRTADDERAVLRALGVPPRSLVSAAAISALVAAALAAVVAGAAAIAASPLAPLGGVRTIEPDRGVDVDVVVVVVGALLVAIVIAAVACVAAVGRGRTATSEREATSTSMITSRLSAVLPPAAGLGVRRGLGASTASGAPVRATVAISAVALATLVAALGFGASIRRLVDEPRRYGWPSDVALTATGGYDVIDVDAVAELLEGDEDLSGMTVAGFSSVELGGVEVPSMWATSIRGGLPFTVLSGRLPNSPDEVAVGRVTADQIGVGIDDEVEGPAGTIRVVGTVALPSIGQITSAHPSLGEGALFTADGLTALDPSAQPSVLFADLVDGLDAADTVTALSGRYGTTTSEGGLEPYLLLRPAELSDADEADTTVTALAGVLGVAAIGGLATVITASVAARRRELAVLRALGYTSGDLRASVRWQSATTATAAALIGLPAGAVAGSLMWRAFAGSLGVDPNPVLPALAIAFSIVGAIALAVLTSLPAARAAATTSVASALRPE